MNQIRATITGELRSVEEATTSKGNAYKQLTILQGTGSNSEILHVKDFRNNGHKLEVSKPIIIENGLISTYINRKGFPQLNVVVFDKK